MCVRLDLQPGRSAPAGLVGRVERLRPSRLRARGPARRRRSAAAAPRRPSRCAGSRARRQTRPAPPGARRAAGRAGRRRPGAAGRTAARQRSVELRRRRANALAVTWNGAGRPSGRSSDRLAVQHQRAHRQRADGRHDLGQPRGDVVEAAGEHAPRRRRRGATCTRAPSSFHSTAAGRGRRQRVVDRRRPADASIGCSGRPTTSRCAASPGPPSVSATRATAPRSPRSMSARRSSAGGTPAAARDRVGHHALLRALAQLARSAGRARNCCSASVARVEQVGQQRAALGLRAGAGAVAICANAASTSATVSVGSAAGARQVAQRRPSRRRSGAGAARRTGTRRRPRSRRAASSRMASASSAALVVRARVARSAAEVAAMRSSLTPPRTGSVERPPRAS